MKTFPMLLLHFALLLPVVMAAESGDVPESFKSLAELQAWVNQEKGFGEPNSAEFEMTGIRLYVTYFSPGSGSPATRSYVYFMSRTGGEWRLIDTHWFDKGGVPSYVHLDGNKDELVFVSHEGRKIRRLPLNDYRNR